MTFVSSYSTKENKIMSLQFYSSVRLIMLYIISSLGRIEKLKLTAFGYQKVRATICFSLVLTKLPDFHYQMSMKPTKKCKSPLSIYICGNFLKILLLFIW